MTLATSPTQTTASTLSGGSVTWTLPAYNNTAGAPGTGTAAYVTVSLDASVGALYNGGLTYPGALSATTKDAAGYEALRKPDGSKVTESDAIAASGSLYGTGSGVTDVRNWIRAASHVRFKNSTRTVDIPIPWKIMDRASSGSPLSSLTVYDRQTVTTKDSAGVPIYTDYGSGTNIEMDQSYMVEGTGAAFNGGVFTSDLSGSALANSAYTTVYLYTTVYRPAYIAWLFNGVWQGASTAANYYNSAYVAGSPYIVFDAANAAKALGQGNVSWGQGFGPAGLWGNIQVPKYNRDGSYSSNIADEASKYKVPALTRMQATKQAAISTWIAHQADVFWAFRCLDPTTTEANAGGATTINNASSPSSTPPSATTNHVPGNDSFWVVLNNTAAQGITSTSGNSVNGMSRIASLFAKGETPLTYAVARALAQFNDPNSVFNSVVGTDVSQCVNHYLVLFTDGVDNNGGGTNNVNSSTPYITGTGATAALSALTGNQAILADPTTINTGGSYWNLFTLGAVGAHLADAGFPVKDVDYKAATWPPPSSSSIPSAFLPFAIKQRNGVTYDKDHRVTIMTVGVSLGGQYTDATSPKRSLFLGAVVGDPYSKSGLLTDFHSFFGWNQPNGSTIDPNNDWMPDPQDPGGYPVTGIRKDGAVFFFDATDPDKLKTSLDYALKLVSGQAGNNATSSPNLPFTGASLGKQIYIGNFNPPKNGGVVWPGDLMMFGTIEDSQRNISIINQSGVPLSTSGQGLDDTTAQWSALKMLTSGAPNVLWSNRKLLTRIPGGSTLTPFKDTGTDYTATTTGLKNFVGISSLVAGSAAQQSLIQYAAGANLGDLDVSGRPKSNRGNIMGDIINSAPAAIEYTWSDVSGSLVSYPRLKAQVDAGGNRFRIILVGTNQGWLHAFGEVTRTENATKGDPTTPLIVKGDVEELWAFMPTDFLSNLNYITVTNNPHRFMVDGTPAIYHLDLAPTTGGIPNGVVDRLTNANGMTERAIAVIGLRKGGRSYYALDILDPFNPALKWSLVPDEAAAFSNVSAGVDLGSVQNIMTKMGFSSATPAIGRVQFGATSTDPATVAYSGGSIRDAVFLGGGFSVPEIEANFTGTPLMGRSVLALDVYTGAVLAAADLTDATIGGSTVGPVGAGLIPFEYILNSGMAQRAYFLDYKGGLWAWGSKAVSATTTYKDFRVDTSELTAWKIRKISQDENKLDSGQGGARYTTVPAPFRVGSFPGVGKTGSASPTAVGIAMVSGDRNNPLDNYGSTPFTGRPDHHRVTVVFDRQDSRAWGLDTATGPDLGIKDADLKNFTGNLVSSTPAVRCTDTLFQQITPGCTNYYLAPTSGAPNYGYYINFPTRSTTTGAKFVPKGINPPIVVAGSLLYSYFTPDKADPCSGGTGKTYSWLTTDVMNPIVDDTRSGNLVKSGNTNKDNPWAGVASDYIALGTRAVLQGGTVVKGTFVPGASLTTPEVHTTRLKRSGNYPQIRVWRTVH